VRLRGFHRRIGFWLALLTAILLIACGPEREGPHSSCGGDLSAEWAGHRRTLSSCAGRVGLSGPDVTISLKPGQQIDLTMFSLPTPLVTNIRSSDADVLAPARFSGAVARFRAVRQGHAVILGNTRACLESTDSTPNPACPLAQITVS
jgi:hypothetical protein